MGCDAQLLVRAPGERCTDLVRRAGLAGMAAASAVSPALGIPRESVQAGTGGSIAAVQLAVSRHGGSTRQ